MKILLLLLGPIIYSVIVVAPAGISRNGNSFKIYGHVEYSINKTEKTFIVNYN